MLSFFLFSCFTVKADACEIDKQHSYVNDHITLCDDSKPSPGAGTDYNLNRLVESYICAPEMAAVPLNRSQFCECNPYWLEFLEKTYPG